MLPDLDTWATTLTIERKLAHQRAERWGSLDGAIPARRSTDRGGRSWIVPQPIGWLDSIRRFLHSSRRLSNLS